MALFYFLPLRFPVRKIFLADICSHLNKNLSIMKRKILFIALPLIVIASAFCLQSKSKSDFVEKYSAYANACHQFYNSWDQKHPDTLSKWAIVAQTGNALYGYDEDIEKQVEQEWEEFPMQTLEFGDDRCYARLALTCLMELRNCFRKSFGIFMQLDCITSSGICLNNAKKICNTH